MLTLNASKLSCIILAAGKSSRMGSNKLLLQFNGKELIRHTLENIIKQGFFEIVVVSGWQSRELESVLIQYPVKVVYNPKYQEGQSTSLKRALDSISDKTLGAFFALGDQPLLKENTIKGLIGTFAENQNCLVAPYYNGQRGNPVVIPRGLFSKLRDLEGDIGARNLFLGQHEIIKFEVDDPGVVLDIDTPEEYEKLLNIH